MEASKNKINTLSKLLDSVAGQCEHALVLQVSLDYIVNTKLMLDYIVNTKLTYPTISHLQYSHILPEGRKWIACMLLVYTYIAAFFMG